MVRNLRRSYTVSSRVRSSQPSSARASELFGISNGMWVVIGAVVLILGLDLYLF